jgi:hypothetical protein
MKRSIGLGVFGLVAVLAGCASPPGGSGSAPAISPGSAAEAPLGVWTMALTADDLAAGGFTDMGAVAENTGTFTFTVAPGGTWTMAQVASQPVRWPVFRGTYVANASGTIQMRTDFPADYAGDVVTVNWTREADGLHLRLVSPDDPLLRLQLEAHPWAPSP